MTKAQRMVLNRMAKGTKLMRCDHVNIQDGSSYFFSAIEDVIRPNTVHSLCQRGWIKYTPKLGGGDYTITEEGREALQQDKKGDAK